MVDRRQCPLSALLLACMLGTASAATNGERQAGDVLSYALPAGVLGAELWRGDRDGAGQFAASFAATVITAEILKRTTGVERPDRSNDQSFPSGHAARAFAAATYVHRRHGVDAALPLYGIAAYVGYTRVQSDRHRWADVAGAAALAAASSWILVEKAPLTVSLAPRRIEAWWSIPLR